MTRQALWLAELKPWLEWVMITLGFIWLLLFGIELIWGLSTPLLRLGQGIWIIFVAEFLFRLVRAPEKLAFLKRNWLTAVALLLPALRVLRFLRALQVFRGARLTRSLSLLRTLGTANRGVGAMEMLMEVQRDKVRIEVGLLPLVTPATPAAELEDFCRRLAADLKAQLEPATGARWDIYVQEAAPLDTTGVRRPPDFLDEATTRMSRQGFDMMLVVTDAPLSSRQHRLQPGLPSTVGHIGVISTHVLRLAPRGDPPRALADANMRWNAAALGLHLIGHLLGLPHRRRSPVMRPFRFDPALTTPTSFTDIEKIRIAQIIRGVPEHDVEARSFVVSFLFHLAMTVRHPVQVLLPAWRNRAFLLSLRMPSLITAAVVPVFVLIFTAEIWDAGFGMSNAKVVEFSLYSMAGATLYLAITKNLFFPMREKRVVTEHIAVMNAAVFCTILAAVIGVFVMLTLLTLAIVLYFIPADLMSTWPTLQHPDIETVDKVRLAAFISGIGVTTGALAGGLESRKLIQHLSLFDSEP